MPERLECEVLQKARYTNTLTFTSYDAFMGATSKAPPQAYFTESDFSPGGNVTPKAIDKQMKIAVS